MVYIVLRVVAHVGFGQWEFYAVYADKAAAKKFVDERNANNTRQYNYMLIARKPK